MVPAKIGTVPAPEFLHLFRQLEWHDEWDIRIGPLKRFLMAATDDGRIVDWTVVWPQPTKHAGSIRIEALGPESLPVITRRRRLGRVDFIGSDAKHRSAALPIARAEPVLGMPGAVGRGVLLITLVDDRPEDEGEKVGQLAVENVVGLMSIATPASATPHRRDLIQWTVRVQTSEADAAVENDG